MVCTARARGSDAFSGTEDDVQARLAEAGVAPAHLGIKVDSGPPTVLAKPAISVMPVISPRESRP
jgi:hypothetical protein